MIPILSKWFLNQVCDWNSSFRTTDCVFRLSEFCYKLLGSSAVTSVNVNSFSNGTILVSWKPPKHLLEDSVDLYEISYVNPSLLNSDIYCSKYFVNINSDGLIHYVWTTRAHTEVLLGNPEVPFKPGNTYTFTITPRWWSGPVCYGLP